MSALTDNVAAAPAAHLQFEDCTGLCGCGQCDHDDGTPDAVTQAGEQLLYGLFAFVAAFCFFLIVAP
jgi:hypothetical protein